MTDDLCEAGSQVSAEEAAAEPGYVAGLHAEADAAEVRAGLGNWEWAVVGEVRDTLATMAEFRRNGGDGPTADELENMCLRLTQALGE